MVSICSFLFSLSLWYSSSSSGSCVDFSFVFDKQKKRKEKNSIIICVPKRRKKKHSSQFSIKRKIENKFQMYPCTMFQSSTMNFLIYSIDTNDDDDDDLSCGYKHHHYNMYVCIQYLKGMITWRIIISRRKNEKKNSFICHKIVIIINTP